MMKRLYPLAELLLCAAMRKNPARLARAMAPVEAPNSVRHEAALIVQPGDTLVVTYAQRLNAQQRDQIDARLRPHLPEGGRLLVLGFEERIGVVRKDAPQ